MKKTRIYELAKELNTTSKRLIEKLEEINITVKNHMSFLDDDQLNALYDHIGVIRHNDGSGTEADNLPEPPKIQKKTEPKKEVRDIPRIIRKTEIIIDSKNDYNKESLQGSQDSKKDIDKKKKGKREFIKVADNSSGLRPGLTRSTGFDYVNELLSAKKAERLKEEKENRQKELRSAEAGASEARDQKAKVENKQASPEHPEKNEAFRAARGAAQEPLTGQKAAPTDKKTQEARTVPDTLQKVSDEESQRKKTDAGPKESPAARAGEQPRKIEQPPKTPAQGRTGAKAETTAHEHAKKDPVKEGKEKQDTAAFKTTDESQVKAETKAIDEKLVRSEDTKGKTEHMVTKEQDYDRNVRRGSVDISQKKKAEKVQTPIANIQSIDLLDVKSEKPKVIKKEYENKYQVKTEKKESKKEVLKTSGRKQKFSPESLIIGQKKKISELLTDDSYTLELLDDEMPTGKKKFPKPGKDVRKVDKKQKHIPQKAVLTSITIPATITVKDLAEALKKTASEVIKKLIGLGVMAAVNQEIDFDTATLVADEFGVKTEKQVDINEEDILFDESEDKESDLVPRPPIVVVMGHVDHGKTSLLDAIRESHVAATEAGGITQHIGAYMVEINGRKITFLDTPGHEAFTSMRARGAQVTDIAILVVAADDGVMPQTVEAINHAKAANVEIIVAINKIDKPGANPDRIKQQLTEHGLLPEEWGGNTICVNISAKKRTNIEELLEMVLLTADVLELKANPDRQAKGTVIEAKLDKQRGAVATLIVQKGTLRSGDTLIAGTSVGHIRAMYDDKNNKIDEAGPSTPVEVLGLDEVPQAGEVFYAVTDEKIARQLVEKRRNSLRAAQIKATSKVSLEDLFSQIQAGNIKDLNIIVKADVQGSVEAVKQSLEKLSNDEVRVNLIHGGVGAINDSDVQLAEVTNAIIIGFNVRPGANVAEAAKTAGVDLRLYRVIYDAIEDIQAAMKGLLEPKFREVIIGHAEVRQTFRVSGIGTIAGCYVTDGKIQRNSEVRLVRDGIVVHEGKLGSLKRFKDDVKEVAQGYECGMTLENYNDIKENDVFEAFVMEEVKE